MNFLQNEPEDAIATAVTYSKKTQRYEAFLMLNDVTHLIDEDFYAKYVRDFTFIMEAARYEAGVIKQMQMVFDRHKDAALNKAAIGMMAMQMRDEIGSPDMSYVAPLTYGRMVGAKNLEPMVTIGIEGNQRQLPMEDAQAHLSGFMKSYAVAQLDRTYLDVLMNRIGLDRDAAHTQVGALAEFLGDEWVLGETDGID